jgi:hypothetical protein
MIRALFLSTVALIMFVANTDILLFGLLASLTAWWIIKEIKNGY